MSKTSFAPVLLFAVAACTPAHAQLLTEERFLEDALASHPDAAAAAATVAMADGARRQAGVFDNPSISWEREDPDVAREDTWRLDWRLPFDGRRHRVAAAQAGVEAAKSGRDMSLLELRLELRSLYAAWFIAEEREAVLENNLERARRLAGWLRARADEGEAAGVEARRLDLEVVSLEQEAAVARARGGAAGARVAVWSHRATGDVRPVRPRMAPPPASADAGDRPDIKALGFRLVESESRHSYATRVLEPPEIGAGWKEISEGDLSSEGPVLGIAWPLPVFDRNQGRRESAEAEVTRAEFELEAAIRRAKQQADAALASYSELYGAVVHGGSNAAERGVAEAVFAAFEAGEASLTDVLDVWRSTVDLQMARLETLAHALAAERELEAAIGRPIVYGES
jgi:cobalt-zinc-cadmium efflux system outer membrane protein